MAENTYEEYKRELNESIGEFVITFETITNEIRLLLQTILMKNGLIESRLFDILTYDSTAKPLLDFMKGFILLCYADELRYQDLKQEMNKLYKRIVKATTKRNNVVHAHWYIDSFNLGRYDSGMRYDFGNYDSIEDFVHIFTTKNKIMKDGIQNVFENKNLKVIQELKNDSLDFTSITYQISKITTNIREEKPIRDAFTYPHKSYEF